MCGHRRRHQRQIVWTKLINGCTLEAEISAPNHTDIYLTHSPYWKICFITLNKLGDPTIIYYNKRELGDMYKPIKSALKEYIDFWKVRIIMQL